MFKLTRLQVSQSVCYCIALLTLCFVAFSCDNNNTTQATRPDSASVSQKSSSESSPPSNQTGQEMQTSEDLYVLYVENISGSEQLRKMLHGGGGKTVFQFYRDSNGVLGLIAYPKLGNNYKPEDTIYLKRTNEVAGKLPSRSQIFLGSLQLGKNILDSLKKHLYKQSKPGNNEGYQYIRFVPEVKNDPSALEHNYVVYHIEPSADASKKSIRLQRIGTANPSPPYDSE